MKPVKWGIIGCGNVCEVKSGPAFYKCEHSSLQAVMRRDPEKAADFAKRHSVAKWYTRAEDLINDPEIDVVYIATPPSSHAEMAILALNAGKPVYVEKPMGVSYKECELMVRVAQKNNQKLWVAYYRRSLPYFLKVKELIDSHVIGNIQVVQTSLFRPVGSFDKNISTQTWRVDKNIAGGGYFYDLAPHTLDILQFLLGKIIRANGIINNVGKFYQTEDTVSASFLFESGIVGSGVWSFVSPEVEKKDEIEIIGERGFIRFSTFDFSAIECVTESGTETFSLPKPEHIQQPLIQSIINEIRGIGKCPSTGESGSMTNWVMDQIFQ